MAMLYTHSSGNQPLNTMVVFKMRDRSHEHGDIINYIDTIALGLLKNKNTNKKECQMGKELEEYEYQLDIFYFARCARKWRYSNIIHSFD